MLIILFRRSIFLCKASTIKVKRRAAAINDQFVFRTVSSSLNLRLQIHFSLLDAFIDKEVQLLRGSIF